MTFLTRLYLWKEQKPKRTRYIHIHDRMVVNPIVVAREKTPEKTYYKPTDRVHLVKGVFGEGMAWRNFHGKVFCLTASRKGVVNKSTDRLCVKRQRYIVAYTSFRWFFFFLSVESTQHPPFPFSSVLKIMHCVGHTHSIYTAGRTFKTRIFSGKFLCIMFINKLILSIPCGTTNLSALH